MKRNTLYTVNRANQPAFMYRENRNLFDLGGTTAGGADVLGSFINNMGNKTPDFSGIASAASGAASSGGGGIAGALGGLVGGGGGIGGALKGALSSAGASGLGGLASAAGSIAGKLIGGGYSSGVGNVMGTLGKVASVIPGPYGMALSFGFQTVGGAFNRLVGSKVDAKRLGEANKEMSALNSFKSNATSFDDIKGATATKSVADIYKGGALNKSAAKDQAALEERMAAARQFADRSIGNNIYNLADDQTNQALANYSAFGGPLGDSFGGALGLMQQNRYIDAINNRSNAITKGLEAVAQQQPTTFTNRFDDGGFVNNFMQDPIAAAMNYIKQRDAEEAQAEAQAAQEARKQEFNNLQTRLMNAETQNQGLQALLEDQGRSIASLQEAQALQNIAAQPQATSTIEVGEPEPAEVLSTPSRAARKSKGNNKTWNYIEGQLRKSGKFNDVQIEGIKYNLQRESALNPNAVGDGGKAFGLGQWHGSRQPKDRSLAGQTQHLIDTLSKFDGTSHWIGRGNYQGFMNARTPEEAHYYITKGYERPAASILSKVKRDSDMSLRNLRAFGGELGTNGTDFTNGLLQVNAGNTHERNPFGGVPMGLDSEGVPNLVEEGETVYNDYVFSKRLKVPNFMLKDLGLGSALPKHRNTKKRLSFADVSKKLAEESEKRPNDPISMNGLNASLSKLMEIQEAERMKQQAKMQNEEMEMMPEMGLMAACGGKLNRYDYGGALNWLRQNHPEMEHKEQIARYLSKLVDSDRQRYYGRSDTSMFGNNDSSRGVEPRYDWAWRALSPVGNINTQAHIRKWMDLGATKDEAFNAVFPKKEDRDRLWVRDMYNKMEDRPKEQLYKADNGKLYRSENARDIANQRYAASRQPQKTTATTPSGRKTVYKSKSGRVFNTNAEALADQRAWEAQQRRQTPAAPAANKQAPRAQAAPTSSSTPSTAASNTSSARSTARRSAAPATTRAAQSNIPAQSNFEAFREYRRNNPFEDTASQNDLVAAAQAMANANGMPLEVEGAALGTNTNPSNRRWNAGNYDWLSGDFNPSNTAGFIPYNRNMSADDIAREENSDRYKAWTDYVLNNWDNRDNTDVQNYLRELDTRAGGNHLFDADGNLREDARDYFQYARGVGNNSNHAWGYYHLTPTWADEVAGNASNAAAASNTPAQAASAQGNNGIVPVREEDYTFTEDELNATGRRLDEQARQDWAGQGNRVNSPRNFWDRAFGTDEEGMSPTWMRYAPVVGAGIMSLTDALGLTNKPDYSGVGALEMAANRAAYAPNVKAPYIGDYMRYTPFDRLFYANQLQANSRATDRALMNTSGGNRGTAMAGLLANAYNTNNNLGNLYRQAEEYNRGQYERTKEFNRRTNMFNAQMGLEADMANARYTQQASQMGLHGLAQAAAMRDQIDARTGAARAANLSNFINGLGDIGRENFAFNQINSDRSRRHHVGHNGGSYDWIARAYQDGYEAALGGKLNKKNKGRRRG